jgi:hypothetical protein
MEAYEQKFLKQTYGGLSGHHLEEIIRFLASLRAQAAPAVADSDAEGIGTHKLGKRDVSVQALPDGGVGVNFAHPGLGWMRVTFTAETARDFAAKVIAAAG